MTFRITTAGMTNILFSLMLLLLFLLSCFSYTFAVKTDCGGQSMTDSKGLLLKLTLPLLQNKS